MRHYLWLRSPFQSIIPTGKFVCGQEANALKSFKKQIGSKKLVLEFWYTLGHKTMLDLNEKVCAMLIFNWIFYQCESVSSGEGGDETEGDHKVWCIPNSILHAYCLRHHMCAMYVCSKYWRVSSTHLEECVGEQHQSNFGSCHHI